MNLTPSLARTALCLALAETIPPDFHPADAQAKALDDDTPISAELHTLVHTALNSRAGHTLDEPAYRQAFRLHFEYGCHRLNQLWQESANDQARFLAALHQIAAAGFRLPLLLDPNCKSQIVNHNSQIPDPLPLVEKEVRLKVLANAPDWSVNGPGTSNGLLVISGQPGSGKTQLALDLLAQLAGQGVRFIFFDMRGELADDPNSREERNNRKPFFEQTGARYIRLIREGLPINPLYRDPNPTSNAQIAYEIANLIRCFAPQFGPRQERNLCETYVRLIEPDFPSLAKGLSYDTTPGVDVAIVEKIDHLKLFASAQDALTPDTWLNTSLVIDFKEFGSDTETKALSAALILNFLMKKLSRNLTVKDGIQPLKMVLFVDEAHLLLPKENKAGLLGSLARQGRSWGFPVWLASQDADAFVTTGANPTNFAELAECGVHFSPHTLTDSQQRMILGGVIPRKLKKGEAVLRLQGTVLTAPARQFWKHSGTISRSGELPVLRSNLTAEGGAFAADQTNPQNHIKAAA